MSLVKSIAGNEICDQTARNNFSNLSIGGRNLWAWSKVVGGYEHSGAYTGALPHCTMPDKISVSPNESLCYQLWNPNKVSNTVNYTRIAWYTSDGTYIKSDELPRLDGVAYYCQTYTAPSNAYYAMLGTMIAPNETITNTVTKTKWERGNKPTDWTPALEDSLTLKDDGSGNVVISIL